MPSNEVVERLASALGVEPEHFREYRLRVITERLERCPTSSTASTSGSGRGLVERAERVYGRAADAHLEVKVRSR